MINARKVLKRIKESVTVDEADIDMSKPLAVVYWGEWDKKPSDHTVSIGERVGLIRSETFATEGLAKRRAKEYNANYIKNHKATFGTNYQVVDLRTVPKSNIS